MKGQIFVINQQKHTGAIAAEDGQHLLFALGEWTEAKPPERGMQVEFEVTADGHAGAVRLAAVGQTPVMSTQAAASTPPRPPTPPTPPAPPPSVPPPAAAASQSPAQQHSGLGIAAFVISLAVGFFALILLIVAGIAYNEGEDDAAEIIGAAFIVITLLQLLPLVLGIIGLRQAGRKKLFAVLGTVISSLALLFALVAMIAGVLDDEDTEIDYAEEEAQMITPSSTSLMGSSDRAVIENSITSIATNENGEEYRDARMVVVGDLNGDGRNDAAVIFTVEVASENRASQILAVFLRQTSGGLNFLDGSYVGTTQGITIRNGNIQLQTLTHGRDDPMCCPSIEGTEVYVVRNGKIRQMSN